MPTYTQSEPRETYFVEPGKYQVEITKGIEKNSQAGNPMIKLTCRVKLSDGTDGPEIAEHLTFTAKAAWKIDQVRQALGQAVVPGEDVSIEAEDFVGMSAWVILGEEPGSTNPSMRFNTIERWIEAKETANAKAQAPVKTTINKDADDDSIPF
jgi:hypothetical protein